MNSEGDGFLYYMCLPHPPAPVLHKHRGLAPAPIRTLQQQQQATDGGTGSHMESLNQGLKEKDYEKGPGASHISIMCLITAHIQSWLDVLILKPVWL